MKEKENENENENENLPTGWQPLTIDYKKS